MINFLEDKVQVRAGKGDLIFSSGIVKDTIDNKILGFISIENAPYIGVVGEEYNDRDKIDFNNVPVALFFENTKCIDVLIKKLNYAKDLLSKGDSNE